MIAVIPFSVIVGGEAEGGERRPALFSAANKREARICAKRMVHQDGESPHPPVQ
jgi:hypothetical protein